MFFNIDFAKNKMKHAALRPLFNFYFDLFIYLFIFAFSIKLLFSMYLMNNYRFLTDF